MLLTSLDRYIDTVLATLLETLGRGSPRLAIRHSVERVLAQLPVGNTCFLHNCALEVARRDSQSRMRVRRGIERLEQGYHDAVVRGQRSGEFRKDGDARTLAKYLVANYYGLQALARAHATAGVSAPGTGYRDVGAGLSIPTSRPRIFLICYGLIDP
jgi:TetR/AcrR family transcriptional repressor of nem operon